MSQTPTATVDVTSIIRIDHDEAMHITAVENGKFGDMMRALSPEQWSTQTECTRWDVRAMAAHLVGSAASQASPREFSARSAAASPSAKNSIRRSGGTE
jgi:hypothetical protein